MADEEDLELDSESNTGTTQTEVRKNISLKLKGKGRGRSKKGGRGRKGTAAVKKATAAAAAAAAAASASAIEEAQNEGDAQDELEDKKSISSEKQDDNRSITPVPEIDDISQLETPSFSPLSREPPEPLHQNKPLKWNHKVNLIGHKVVSPMVHYCEKCQLPIRTYGRMIPCKHVFCFGCAKKAEKICLRCSEKVTRLEESPFGTVFMCTYGSSKYGKDGCRRTYLSQRDLQAHVDHRHTKITTSSTPISLPMSHSQQVTQITTMAPTVQTPAHMLPARDPRSHLHTSVDGMVGPAHTPPHPPLNVPHIQKPPDYRDMTDIRTTVAPAGVPPPPTTMRGYINPATTVSHASYPAPIPVVSTRSNLITVPIHDDSHKNQGPHMTSQLPPPPPQFGAPGQPHPQSMIPGQPHPASVLQHTAPPQPYPGPPPPVSYPHPGHPPQTPASTFPQGPPTNYAPPTLSQPPPTHLPPPPIHSQAPPSLYSAPPMQMHPGQPSSFSGPPPQGPPPPRPPPPHPPRFPPAPMSFDDNSPYRQQWNSGPPPPPPPQRGPCPPRPMGGPPPNPPGLGMPRPPCGDPGFRPPYYSQ